MANILVTGGAGYIGSHVVKQLGEAGHNITIIDNLSTGKKESVLYGKLFNVDLSNFSEVEKIFKNGNFDSCFHFAGSIVVPESVENPLKYYQNNTVNTLGLLKLCDQYNVNNFIFSSTAAVYGINESGICSEESPIAPINPYGWTKFMTEQMLQDLSLAKKNFNFVVLRYFNVAGASADGKVGQCFPNATHLIKLACQTATGQRESLDVFGTNYDTPDGTCIRDYIHVDDLSLAHIKALDYLSKGGQSEVLNCGYGHGYSVKEVIKVVKEVSGVDFKVIHSDRRAGDAVKLISKAEKIKNVLNWNPKYDNLKFIVKSALDWEEKLKSQL